MPSTFTSVGDGTRTSFQLPIAVQAASDVTSVLVNGSAGPSVSSVAGDLVNLASAPAAGAAVAITVKDRRGDEYIDFLETNDRPVLTSYSTATHTLVGTAVPGNIVDIFLIGNGFGSAVWMASVQAAADGAFSYVNPSSFGGTQIYTATQRRPDTRQVYTAFADGYGITTTY